MIVVGTVIGVGIFQIPSEVAKEVGSFWPIMGVWLGGGFVAFLGSLTYAEVATTWPRTGGPYASLRECLGPLPSFLSGWGQLVIVRPLWLAVIALILAEYFSCFFPATPVMVRVIAICAVLVASLWNHLIGELPTAIARTLTLLKVVMLVFIVAMIVLLGEGGGASTTSLSSPVATGSYWSSIGIALLFVFWAYDGWNEVTVIAGQADQPEKTIRRAAWIGCVGVILFYLLINAVFLNELGVSGVAGSNRVAADAAASIFGTVGKCVVAGLVVVVAFEALGATALAGSRLFFSMAVEGIFFSWARKVDERSKTPTVAIVLQALLAVAALLVWNVAEMIICTMVVAFLFHNLISIMILCQQKKGVGRTTRVRQLAYRIAAPVYLLLSLLLFLNAFLVATEPALTGLFLLLVGVPTYWIWKGSQAKRIRGG